MFVDGVALAKDVIPSHQAREEGIRLAHFAARERLLHEEDRLVDSDELGEIECVLLCCLVDVLGSLLPAEEEPRLLVPEKESGSRRGRLASHYRIG